MSFITTAASLTTGAGVGGLLQGKTGRANGIGTNWSGKLGITSLFNEELYPSDHDDSMDLDHWSHMYVLNYRTRIKGWLKELQDSFVNGLKSAVSDFLTSSIDTLANKAVNGLMNKILGDVSNSDIMDGIGALRKWTDGKSLSKMLMDAIFGDKAVKTNMIRLNQTTFSTNKILCTMADFSTPWTYSVYGAPEGMWTGQKKYENDTDIKPFTMINFYDKLTGMNETFSMALNHMFHVQIQFDKVNPNFFIKDQSNDYFGKPGEPSNLNYFTNQASLPNVELKEMDSESNEFGYMHVTSGKLLPENNTFTITFLDTDIPIFEYLIYPWMKEIAGDKYAYDDRPYTKATFTVNYYKMSEQYLVKRSGKIQEIFAKQKQISELQKALSNSKKKLEIVKNLPFRIDEIVQKRESDVSSLEQQLIQNRNSINEIIQELDKTKNYKSFVQYKFFGVIPKSFITRDISQQVTTDFGRTVTFQFENMTINNDGTMENRIFQLTPSGNEIYNFANNAATSSSEIYRGETGTLNATLQQKQLYLGPTEGMTRDEYLQKQWGLIGYAKAPPKKM